MEDKFTVKKSGIDGKGCFATSLIKKEEVICFMKGQLLSIPELIEKYEKGEERISDPLQVEERNYLDLDEPYIFFNHSCKPNAAVVKFNELIAIRDIKSGEEIVFDYSLTEWSEDADWEDYNDWIMDCNCKTLACRKKIREFRFLPSDIQDKSVLWGVIPDHIKIKYKKCYGNK